MAKHNIGAKHFFTITALSCTLLVMFFVTGVIQVPTRTASDASGISGISLNDCTVGNYDGGVKLFNGDNYAGGDRVACISSLYRSDVTEYSDNLNKQDLVDPITKEVFSTRYNEIWGNFQLKTESMKIRVNEKCKLTVKLYSEYNAPKHAELRTFDIDRLKATTPHTKSIELPNSVDNKAKSIKMKIQCNRGY